MRTTDIDYDLEVAGVRIMLTITYRIEFSTEGRRTDEARVILSAYPEAIQAMIGGMPFREVKWANVSKDFPLYGWILSRASELTLEACGYTEREAMIEACDEEDDLADQARQIGRPL